jgi:hypothetical protein
MIKVLTAEESMEMRQKELEMKRLWSREQIVADAKLMMGMPDMGNTKWVLSEDREGFYKWLESNEAREVWNETPYILELAKYYTLNKTNQNGNN